jgi:hypothetical protein
MSNDNKLAYMRHAPTGIFDGASAQLMAVNGNDEIKRRGWWQSMGLWSSGGAPGGGWRLAGTRGCEARAEWIRQPRVVWSSCRVARGHCTGRELELHRSWRVTAMWSSAGTAPTSAPPCALRAPHHAWDAAAHGGPAEAIASW